MAMVVKNNIPAKNTLNQADKNDKALAKSLKKLSSGMKINSAADDASGFSISEKMRVQVRGLEQDIDNAQTGVSMMKVAEGGLQSTIDILSTLKEKVINAANDTNTDADRATIQKELNQAVDQLDDNANVQYNGKTMLDGSRNNYVKNPGTYTSLANESLYEGTNGSDRITSLRDFAGRSLGISSDSTIEFSYVLQGETYTTTLAVGSNILTNMFSRSVDDKGVRPSQSIIKMEFTANVGKDRVGDTVTTVNGNKALVFSAGQPGLDGQISGLTINVINKDGTINRTANAVLNNFTEAVQAENESPDNALVYQVGTKANQAVKIGFSDMRSVALGLKATNGDVLSIATQKKANAAISVLELAMEKALKLQTTIGAMESRMDFTVANLTTSSENTQATESVIRDADMAKEMTGYTKNNVLMQASQSMLAQANQSSSSVLSLLQ
ncbi:flagellin N-terminal helical domain-containing protein [Selenomonas ruminantium]|uniref:Flagellin n=1 Tax=Selenomonas ruminantium TaxID=971 RepID=A0A1I0YFI1_SELRU|nr:flagellin [Selenomonas ruminantium]SFB11526.1 flagellin [Selenomonas ruminantium]